MLDSPAQKSRKKPRLSRRQQSPGRKLRGLLYAYRCSFTYIFALLCTRRATSSALFCPAKYACASPVTMSTML